MRVNGYWLMVIGYRLSWDEGRRLTAEDGTRNSKPETRNPGRWAVAVAELGTRNPERRTGYRETREAGESVERAKTGRQNWLGGNGQALAGHYRKHTVCDLSIQNETEAHFFLEDGCPRLARARKPYVSTGGRAEMDPGRGHPWNFRFWVLEFRFLPQPESGHSCPPSGLRKCVASDRPYRRTR